MATAEEVFDVEAQVHEIMVRLRADRLSVDEVQRGLQATMEGRFRDVAESKTYLVTPDIARSFEEMKATAGQTYWDPDINESNFSLTEGNLGEQVLELYHFNRTISDAQATQELDALGYVRVTELPVILAFLEANSSLQRQFPIVTNAAWTGPDGDRRVVYAYGDSQRRYLDLFWDGHDWHAACRFLVRRK